MSIMDNTSLSRFCKVAYVELYLQIVDSLGPLSLSFAGVWLSWSRHQDFMSLTEAPGETEGIIGFDVDTTPWMTEISEASCQNHYRPIPLKFQAPRTGRSGIGTPAMSVQTKVENSKSCGRPCTISTVLTC